MGNSSSRKTRIDPRHLKPSGLYPRTDWDDGALKKMVQDRKIAPFFEGKEMGNADTEECPICFLNYGGGLNRSVCCRQGICSECYLQVRKKRLKENAVQCPFCKHWGYRVIYRGPLTETERESNVAEEEKVRKLEVEVRMAEERREQERLLKRAADLKAGIIRPSPPPSSAQSSPVAPDVARVDSSRRRRSAAHHSEGSDSNTRSSPFAESRSGVDGSDGMRRVEYSRSADNASV